MERNIEENPYETPRVPPATALSLHVPSFRRMLLVLLAFVPLLTLCIVAVCIIVSANIAWFEHIPQPGRFTIYRSFHYIAMASIVVGTACAMVALSYTRRGFRQELVAFLAYVPFLAVVLIAASLFALVSVGWFDPIPLPWGDLLYRAVGYLPVAFIAAGMTSAIIAFINGPMPVRVTALIGGGINLAILLYSLWASYVR